MKKTNDVDIENNALYKYIGKIVEPIFRKVANETTSNRVSVGSGRSSSKNLGYYSPHFYRLYIDFSKKGFKPPTFIKTDPKRSGVPTYQLKNHDSEHEFTNFHGCRITVKKTQIEIQNYIDHKKHYIVDIGESAKSQTIEIIRKKDLECLNALKLFIKAYGGSSNYKILNRKGEHKIYGTTGINTLPMRATFHNDIMKKVYNEKNVEFYDPVFAVNHLVNSGVIEVVPSLVRSINSLAYNINPLRTLKGLTKNINDVIKNKDLIIKLSSSQMEEFSLWLYTLQEVST